MDNIQEEINTKLKLVSKTVWSAKEIMIFLKCKSNKATIVKNTASKDFNGAVKFNTTDVTVESVLNCVGTTREREILNLKSLSEVFLTNSKTRREKQHE